MSLWKPKKTVMKNKFKLLSVIGLVTGLALSAQADTLITVRGSDTLGAKLIPQLAEAFKAKHPDATFAIAAEGSSTGISAIIDGTARIGLSSRDIKSSEFAKAEANKVLLTPTTIALDGIALIVNAANPIADMELKQVEAIFTGDVDNWASLTGRPGPIGIYTRNTASGTFAVFKEMAMANREYTPRSQMLAGNEQIASEVANNPNGIGYVGLAYIHTPGIKVVTINGISPDNPKYPLARPLYVLTNGFPTHPQVAEFLNFTLSSEGQQIVRRNEFIPLR
jgi:phosphate transport system substrate-binding protein